MPYMTWQCQCGNVLFSFRMERTGAIERYIFVRKCSRCGRERRRCFWLNRDDYRSAKAILKAIRGRFIARPIMAMPITRGTANVDMLHIRPLVEGMIRRGFKVGAMRRALSKRGVWVAHSTVAEIVDEYGPMEFRLTDAPPFCTEYIYGNIVDFPDEMIYMPVGHILNLCPFCMFKCGVSGVKCKMIKESTERFRFLQLGHD